MKIREGGVIGRLGSTEIVVHLMETDFLIVVYVTTMSIRFGFGGGPTTINRISVTALTYLPLSLFHVCCFNHSLKF